MDNPPNASVAEDEEESTDFGELAGKLARAAKKRILMVCLTSLGTLAVAIGALLFVPEVYKSEATIMVVEQQIPQNLVTPLTAAIGAQKLQAMKQEILSRTNLLKVIEETTLFSDKKKWSPDAKVETMLKSMSIEPDSVTREGFFNSFVISYSAPSPGVALAVTRRLAALFIERHRQGVVNRANTTKGFLASRLEEKKKNVAQLEQQIRDFRLLHAGELPESRLSNETRLAELRVQLESAKAGLSRAKQQRVIWQATLTGTLNSRVARLKAERAALLGPLTSKHPAVVAKSGEISDLERLMADVHSGLRASGQVERLAALDPTVAQLQGQLDANLLETATLTEDQERIQASLLDMQRRVNQNPGAEQQLAGMVREAEVRNQEIAKLDNMDQQSMLAAEMENGEQGEQFRQLDPPSFPLKPVSPQRFKITASAAFGGFVLGLLVAFIIEMLPSAFHSEKEVIRSLRMPFVVSLPELSTNEELKQRYWKTGIHYSSATAVVTAIAVVEAFVYKRW